MRAGGEPFVCLTAVSRNALERVGQDMEEMNEKELKKIAIEKYINIQRIKKHGQEEVEYQEKIAKAELQILGISTEDLEIVDE